LFEALFDAPDRPKKKVKAATVVHVHADTATVHADTATTPPN
jgi:hypothetical protein